MEKNELLFNNIAGFLQENGFKKEGKAFSMIQNNNCGIIEFDMHPSNTKKFMKFTLNLKISSQAIMKYEDADAGFSDKRYYQWNERIGFLQPKKQDYWWLINKHTVLLSIQADLFKVLHTIAIPYLKTHISDDDLIDNWMSGKAPGLSQYDKFENLIILLKKHNNSHLDKIVSEYQIYAQKNDHIRSCNLLMKNLGIPQQKLNIEKGYIVKIRATEPFIENTQDQFPLTS